MTAGPTRDSAPGTWSGPRCARVQRRCRVPGLAPARRSSGGEDRRGVARLVRPGQQVLLPKECRARHRDGRASVRASRLQGERPAEDLPQSLGEACVGRSVADLGRPARRRTCVEHTALAARPKHRSSQPDPAVPGMAPRAIEPAPVRRGPFRPSPARGLRRARPNRAQRAFHRVGHGCRRRGRQAPAARRCRDLRDVRAARERRAWPAPDRSPSAWTSGCTKGTRAPACPPLSRGN